MAIWLGKLIYRKIKESQNKAVPTTDESHLVPERAQSGQSPQQQYQQSGVIGGQQQRLQKSHIHNSEHSAASTKNGHINAVSAEEVARARHESRQRTIRQWKLMAALILPNFLAAMDVTIVAPAIPLISSHFNRLSGSFNWIVAAYTLTFTTFVPITGQLAEIYGRHFTLQFEMFWIMIGSVLCAAAQTWGMLLFGRALQGLGAAGIMSLSRIILSDGATLAEISRSNSVLSLISGVSYAVGPVIGGNLASAGWRYLFILPIGVAALSIVITFVLVRKELTRGRASAAAGESRRLGYITGLKIIDWPGLVMFILGVGSIILAVQWGGTSYAWDSTAVIVPFIVGGVLCIAFFLYEYLLGPGRMMSRIFSSQIPMIPSTLFRKKDTNLLMIINFSAGISLVSAFYFISYYFQLVEGLSPSDAGTQLLYYTPGLGVGVYAAMFLCNRFPRQTFYPLVIGSIVEGVGLSLLTYSVSTRNQTTVKVFLAISGGGTGLRFMPVVLHAAGTWSTRIPAMQSLLSFMLPLGETIGISMMGAVFSNKLNTGLARIDATNPAMDIPTNGPPSFAVLNALPAGTKNDIQNAAARAVMWAFVSVLPFVGLSIIASLLLGNVWIGKPGDEKTGRAEQKGKVMYGMYLPALLSGNLKAHKQSLDIDVEHDEDLRREKVGDGDMRREMVGDVEARGALAASQSALVGERKA